MRLVLEYLGKLLTQQACLRRSWNALGCLVACSWQAPVAPSKHGNLMRKAAVFELLRAPRRVKTGPQKPLGAFLERLGLMQASWSVLGCHFDHHVGALFGPKPSKSRSQLLFFGS